MSANQGDVEFVARRSRAEDRAAWQDKQSGAGGRGGLQELASLNEVGFHHVCPFFAVSAVCQEARDYRA